jgi:hypothetical protein
MQKAPPARGALLFRRRFALPLFTCAHQHLSPMGQTAMQLKQVYWNPMKDA